MECYQQAGKNISFAISVGAEIIVNKGAGWELPIFIASSLTR